MPRARTSAKRARKVMSGFSASRARTQGRSFSSENGRLPPIGNAAGLPVVRTRCAQRIAVAGLTSKCSAACRQLIPALIAATTRSRKSNEYGRPIDAGLHPSQHLESEITPRRNPYSIQARTIWL